MISVLFITYNRLEYTKVALNALVQSDAGCVIVIDNGSTDGTVEFLRELPLTRRLQVHYNETNLGIAHAMNQFLQLTEGEDYVGKVDNDTVVPADWVRPLVKKCNDLAIDIIQARHPISDPVYAGGSFDEWMKTMKADASDPSIRYHHFVGGSGIVFRRDAVPYIADHEWKLYGWNKFQKDHPELKKAFCTDVTIRLLDMKDGGGADYSQYPEYYRETRRTR